MTSSEKEEKLIVSRAEDTISSADKKYQVKYIGFLSPFQRGLIMKNVYPIPDVITVFDGGYEDAERTMFICHPEYIDYDIDEIISVVRITGRDISALTHRDYLGSLMGLGITRENIGDILIDEKGAFLFVKSDIAGYVMQNLDKVGRNGIKKEIVKCSEIVIPPPKLKELSGTIASERIDAFVAFVAGVSRNKACEMIERELVSLNFEVVSSTSAKVEQGDLISIRGFGRVRLREFGGTTRKGRIPVKADKFE